LIAPGDCRLSSHPRARWPTTRQHPDAQSAHALLVAVRDAKRCACSSTGSRFLCHRLDQLRRDLHMLRSQHDRDPLTPPVTAVEPTLTGRSRSSKRGRTGPNGAQRAQNPGADHDPISRCQTPCSRSAPEAVHDAAQNDQAVIVPPRGKRL
jgi:hypothetical protein